MSAATKNTKSFYNTEIPSDWKIIQLGAVVTDMKSGLSRELSNEDIGLPVIRSNNLINNTVDYSDIKYWHSVDNQGANTENYFLFDGDILVNFINSISQIGKCAYFINVLKRPIIFTTNLMVVRFNSTLIDSSFFLYYTLINHYQKFVDSITKPAINQASFTTKDYKKLLIPLPPLPEQKAIAKVLSTADAAIHTTEKLIGLKELRKKWLMQQLLTGKKRLKGFGGEWEDVELGELLDYEQPTKYLVKDTLYDDSYATPVLTAGKTFILGYTNEVNGICTDLPVVIFDDFTTATKFVDFPFKAKSSAMKLLRPKDNVNLKFVYEAMQLLNYVVGGHERHWISKFVYLTISCPRLNEQTSIAKVLQAADKEIEKLKMKKEKLKELKKGLMQQLLTGKVRLKID